MQTMNAISILLMAKVWARTSKKCSI